MGPDILGGNGPQDRVGQGMQPDIGVRMADQPMVVGNPNPAQHHMVAGAEAMNIESRSCPRFHRVSSKQPRGKIEILGRGDLDVVPFASNQRHRKAGVFRSVKITRMRRGQWNPAAAPTSAEGN